MLEKLAESNQALVQRVEQIEQGHINTSQSNHCSQSPDLLLHRAVWHQRMYQDICITTIPQFKGHQAVWGISPYCCTFWPQQPPAQVALTSNIHMDGMMPSLETLRRMAPIQNSVSNLLLSYEDQASASIQGKPVRKSGHYITVDVVQPLPENLPNMGVSQDD